MACPITLNLALKAMRNHLLKTTWYNLTGTNLYKKNYAHANDFKGSELWRLSTCNAKVSLKYIEVCICFMLKVE